jgi:nucleoside-diphosphate-sugar epimerase
MSAIPDPRHILITGGAGYIGSLLAGKLLREGYRVTVVDDLLFGGESLLAYLPDPDFHFVKSNVCESRAIRSALRSDWPRPEAIVHLAGIVGFPACQAVGRQVAWRYNVESTQTVFEQAEALGVKRFVYASTYSNYGLSADGKPVTEDTPLNPQSLYAETKIASERLLLSQTDSACAPLIFRIATLYGLSPRTRFDLIVNQFVLEAYTRRELLIYQRGYSRSFAHVQDAIAGIILGLQCEQEKIRSQVFNLGSTEGNYTKDQIVALILKRLPETVVRYKDMTFGGDMRDISVDFSKIERLLGFKTRLTVDDGIREILQALRSGMIRNPQDQQYRNAQFIVQ